MDVEALIAPLSEEEGEEAGPDLAYSNERAAIEEPFNLDAAGTEVEERGWRESIRQINSQAQQTRDLWLAIYLARGGAKVGDLQIVADGATMLAGLLENLWVPVHPTLEEADFIGRKSACDSLTKIREFIAPLKKATVFEHRQGKVTGEDLERFASEGGGADGYAQFRAAIDTNDAERAAEIKALFAETVARFDAIKDGFKRADAVLVANAGSETGTNFQATYDTIDSLRAAVLPYAGMEPEPEAAPSYAGDSGGGGGSSGGPSPSGRVNTRDDVIRAIDAIVEYYSAREPASPVPTLMKRARQWVGMDFIEILTDLMPDSVASAKQVLVSKADQQTTDDGYSSY